MIVIQKESIIDFCLWPAGSLRLDEPANPSSPARNNHIHGSLPLGNSKFVVRSLLGSWLKNNYDIITNIFYVVSEFFHSHVFFCAPLFLGISVSIYSSYFVCL